MKKSTRLVVLLSLAWIFLASPVLYFINTRIMRNDAEQLVIYCEVTHPNEVEYLQDCRKDSDKIFDQMAENNRIQVPLMTLASLALFWIIGFLFMKAKSWVYRGS